ncbi:hypothetical protein C8J55DRAFT_565611 [Lentinula edodes]|uniref:Uncharacterized protein n=1 Tax=Lentinula lateritia TaxID=40482 RepID=A0A9W8ZV44_9AGAR|nr:hypothetical protein C8J55DRAFT_565611 [Lentinula edodes]
MDTVTLLELWKGTSALSLSSGILSLFEMTKDHSELQSRGEHLKKSVHDFDMKTTLTNALIHSTPVVHISSEQWTVIMSSPCPFVPATYTEFSLLSISLSLFLSTLVYCLYDPIHAFTSCLSNPSESPSSPTPTTLDLNLGNVEATSHVKPRIASPLPPPTLEDILPQAQSPGTYPPGRIPSRELTTSRPISIYDLFECYIDVLASTTPTTQYYKVPYFYLTSLHLRDLPGPPRNPLKGHHLFAPATTRSFLSSVAVPVAPFEHQPAPSMLQHKPYLKTYSDPGLTL